MSKPVQYFYVAGAFLIVMLVTDGFASVVAGVMFGSALANAVLEAFNEGEDE